MAGVSANKLLVQHVYASLKAACCPAVKALCLQDADRMLQLLCSPSQQRTDILVWLFSRISLNFASCRAVADGASNPNDLMNEMAVVGQELLLCKADDLDLLRGDADAVQQLELLRQLLTLVPSSQEPPGLPADGEALIEQLFAAENLPQLAQMLQPAAPTCPEHITFSYEPSEEEPADVEALLRSVQSELEQLQAQCEFVSEAAPAAAAAATFTPSSLRVASSDLRQLMAAFSHIYESDLKEYCSREQPGCSAKSTVFQRVQQLLLACNTELEMLKEACEASASVTEEVQQLQTQPQYWSRGGKRTLPDQLEEVSRTIRDSLCQLHSS